MFDQRCGAVTAIAVAFVFGLDMATVECPALTRAFGEIKRVISLAIAKAAVPLLPFYILTVVADLTARGTSMSGRDKKCSVARSRGFMV